MFTKYDQLSYRRKIADIHNRKSGSSLFVNEFKARYGRQPSEVECLHEVDRLQKLIDKKKGLR